MLGMKSVSVIALLCILQGAMGSDMSCPAVYENSTEAERNIAWTCEQISWRNVLAEWKHLTETQCNITLAQAYWDSAFECPDTSGIRCLRSSSQTTKKDSFGCRINVCSDGLYADDTVYSDFWRENLASHKILMMIYKEKLVDCCKNRCLQSDAITIQAWNSQNLKYLELAKQLNDTADQISQLNLDSDSASKSFAKVYEQLEDTSAKVTALEGQTADLSSEYSSLKSALNNSETRINDLEKQVTDGKQKLSRSISLFGRFLKLEEVGGRLYKFGEESSNDFDAARTYCQGLGGDLATKGVRNETVFKELYRIGKIKKENYWVGLTDRDEEGKYEFVDGVEGSRYASYWEAGEPSHVGNQNCMYLWTKSNKKLNDIWCDYAEARPLCEMEI